jgi:hypothetical protein
VKPPLIVSYIKEEVNMNLPSLLKETEAVKAKVPPGKTKNSCSNLVRFNALLQPGEVEKFEAFKKDFSLTDIVLDLYSIPDGLNSKASCSIWLVTPSEGTSEYLFKCFVDRDGHQIHLNSGVYCPKGSYLTANSGIFVEGPTSSLRVLLTGFYC